MDGTHPLTPPLPRRVFSNFVLAICLLLIVHAYALQPFQVPTGSMAPALIGNHRSVDCPRCGFPVVVGRTPADKDGRGGERCYAKAACPNCGSGCLPLGCVTQSGGDHVLVAKNVYNWRRPRRWEVVVFHLFGKIFIKRIIGLPGEEIALLDGDIYIDGEPARKTFDQAWAMRVPVFDNDFAPSPDGWKERWEWQGSEGIAAALDGGDRRMTDTVTLELDGRTAPQRLKYRHFSLGDKKCQPILDEYAYNAGSQAAPEAVRDFLMECEVEIVEGKGSMVFGLSDGGDHVEVEVPLEAQGEWRLRTGPHSSNAATLKNPSQLQLLPGNHYHIVMALVDRRVSFRVNGRDAFVPLDLAPMARRDPVVRPLWFQAGGALVRLRHVRLFRDLHYSQAGSNAVRGRAVRLAEDQAFVLGDNSSNSEDSRHWPEQGAVPLESLVGRAFLVHVPGRAPARSGWPWSWPLQLPHWQSVRWVK